MSSFVIWWIVFAVAIVALAWFAGKSATGKQAGILIDSRGRISLTHVQVVVWTVLILSAFLAALVASCFDISKAALSTHLLGLMGIVAGSAVFATGVKAAKDAPGSEATVAREGTTINFTAANGQPKTLEIKAKFSQIWLEEEGPLADRTVNVTKFQNFIFTLAAVAIFVALAIKAGALPRELPDYFLGLLGISHAGYVGGKIPDKK
ncbi:MAG TPA: hypothetical protein VJ724_07105 [Tahibacter sp.]|nr:hypothetical protein [Tahibacter sp.]